MYGNPMRKVLTAGSFSHEDLICCCWSALAFGLTVLQVIRAYKLYRAVSAAAPLGFFTFLAVIKKQIFDKETEGILSR